MTHILRVWGAEMKYNIQNWLFMWPRGIHTTSSGHWWVLISLYHWNETDIKLMPDLIFNLRTSTSGFNSHQSSPGETARAHIDTPWFTSTASVSQPAVSLRRPAQRSSLHQNLPTLRRWHTRNLSHHKRARLHISMTGLMVANQRG